MTAFEILSIAIPLVLTVLGGAWALLERNGQIKQQLEATEAEHTNKAISRLDSVLDRLGIKLEELEKKFDSKVDELSKKLYDVRVALIKNAGEIKEARNSMGVMHKAFEVRVDKISSELNKLQETYIGEGRYRLTGTKPKG